MTFDADKLVSFDLETHLIQPGILAPRIVCGSSARIGEKQLLDRVETLVYSKGLLRSECVIVGANIAYDFGCLSAADPRLLPLIFRAYEEGRVFDVQIAQALHAIAEGNLFQDPATGAPLKGRYSLERCVKFVLGREDAKKNDTWRLRYAELDGTPLDKWPEEARQYPIDDAVNTLEVAVAQVRGGGGGVTPGPHRNLGDLSNQAEAAWALHLGAMWGLRTDLERVAELRARVEKDHAAFVERFKKIGFFVTDETGALVLNEKGHPKENGPAIKRAVVIAYGGGDKCTFCKSGKVPSPKQKKKSINCKACSGTGINPGPAPLTPTGGIRADRDAKLESGDPDLIAFGDNEPEKILKTYLPALQTEKIGRQLSPNILVASGRISYDGLIQLLPKEGGVRECHRARPDSVLCDIDFAAIELCTWAQIKVWLFGQSVMADTINATGDPGALHTAFAATLCNKTTEEMMVALKSPDPKTKAWAKRYRDAAKAGNFGFPGGMGAAKFVFAKRKKSEGKTTAPDGMTYPGIRFCILLGGMERCGVEKVAEWRGRPTPAALCRRCVEIAEELRAAWFKQWPEAKRYLDWVSNRVGDQGRGELPCFGTDRVRGGLDFPNGANNGFQALASDGVKHGVRLVTRESLLDTKSVLYQSRTHFIFSVHDQNVAEMLASLAHLAGPRMAEVMINAMREYTPDITIVAEPALMRHWTKAAEPTYRDGRLIPWEDREVSNAT